MPRTDTTPMFFYTGWKKIAGRPEAVDAQVSGLAPRDGRTLSRVTFAHKHALD